MKICSIFLLFLVFTDPSTYPFYRVYSELPRPLPTSKGELIYQEAQCALCHGELGDGEGFLANGLEPRPRDFTSLEQMIHVPDMQMISAIRDGVEGTAMPAHPDFSDVQILDLLSYLRSLLADTYMTVNLCINQTFVLDTKKEDFEFKDFQVKVDNPGLITVKREGRLIYINPTKNWETMKILLSKRVTRTYVKLIGKDKLVSLIAVRLHRCIR